MSCRPSERETQGAIDFDAALEGYASSYDPPEVLLRAAGLVLGSTIPLDEEHARAIAELTGAIIRLEAYDDAGRCRAAVVRGQSRGGRVVLKQRQWRCETSSNIH